MSKRIQEVCVNHLYDDVSKLQHLEPDTIKRLLRIRSAYALMNEFPSKKDREIVMHMMAIDKIEKSTAYEDLRIIKNLLGTINRQTKDWHRFKFNNMVMKAYDIAELKNDPDAMQKAANTYAKYNQLDKEDIQQIPWDEIVPQTFIPTDDPSVLGIKPMPNFRTKQAELNRKYEAEIQDITYEEIDIQELEKYADQ